MDKAMQIGIRLKNLRESNGMTMKDVSELLSRELDIKYIPQTIYKWENAINRIPMVVAIAYCDIFNTPIESIAGINIDCKCYKHKKLQAYLESINDKYSDTDIIYLLKAIELIKSGDEFIMVNLSKLVRHFGKLNGVENIDS